MKVVNRKRPIAATRSIDRSFQRTVLQRGDDFRHELISSSAAEFSIGRSVSSRYPLSIWLCRTFNSISARRLVQIYYQIEGAKFEWMTTFLCVGNEIRRKKLVLGLLSPLRNLGACQDQAVVIILIGKVERDWRLARVTREAMPLFRAVPHLDQQCVMRPARIAGHVLSVDHAATF